jgi:hypothetical protein
MSAASQIPLSFGGSEGSLPHSHAPANCPYPEPDRSSPCLHISFPEDPFDYYPPKYA